jgi:hypothetical protein
MNPIASADAQQRVPAASEQRGLSSPGERKMIGFERLSQTAPSVLLVVLLAITAGVALRSAVEQGASLLARILRTDRG